MKEKKHIAGLTENLANTEARNKIAIHACDRMEGEETSPCSTKK